MNGFWKNWLVVWCWGVLAFGVVLALAAVPAASGYTRLVITTLGGDPALLDQPALQFAFGLQGALSIGWALTMMALVNVADSAPVWRALTVSVAVWYVIDSVISVVTGFPLNAVSNTLLMVAFLTPMLASGTLRGGGRVATA